MAAEAARPSVSVAGVVVSGDGRALLACRRVNGRWEAPGGVLERDEDILTGLRREVAEETGLRGKPGVGSEPVALTGVYKNLRLGVVSLVFRCRRTGGRLATSDETTGFRWAD